MTNTTAAEMEQVREDLKREAESTVPICPEHGERPVAAGLPDQTSGITVRAEQP